MRIILAVVILALVMPPAILLFNSTATTLELAEPVKVIGTDTPIAIKATNSHGVRQFSAFIEQNGARVPAHQANEPPRRWSFFRQAEPPRDFRFTVHGRSGGLKDGKARLVIEAVSNDLRARTDRFAVDVDINTTPPAVFADGEQHYINQGGAELVTMTVSGYWTEAGVRVGKYTFRSFPVPGGAANQRLCFFAYPYDVPPDTAPIVYARNPSGAEATGRFWFKLFRKKFRSRDIDLTDAFMDKVTREIDPNGSGDLVARFLKINGDRRRQDNQVLYDLRLKTADKFLWSGPFQQLANSEVESRFCDFRSYVYNKKKVDEQVHLGFDLAVNKNTPVVAANSGKVVHAAYLGIYGNAIVIDHGFGLQSLYAHLSQISVKPGDDVKKGQVIGKSGATGLAGGDHLHFTTLVDGVPANPVEWWDSHWIQDRVLTKVKM